MQPPLEITFENGATAKALSISKKSELLNALEELGLKTSRPTLVIVGGASGLAADDLEKLRSLFEEVLCPFADSLNFTVIDGGTDAGVMKLMGQARAATSCQFPLVGVVVQQKAILPYCSSHNDDAAALEPHHTHFILVPGSEWGDESDWIADTATVLSNQEKSSMTMLINGGAIALHQDVPNSLEHTRPVLIVAGSGRSADYLANAMTGKTSEPEVQDLVDSGLLYTVDLKTGKEALQTALEQVLEADQ
jgi:hypothetical protein